MQIVKCRDSELAITSYIGLLRNNNDDDAVIPFMTALSKQSEMLYAYDSIDSYRTSIQSMSRVKIKNVSSHCSLLYLMTFVISTSSAQSVDSGIDDIINLL
jgi:hypothetical protein